MKIDQNRKERQEIGCSISIEKSTSWRFNSWRISPCSTFSVYILAIRPSGKQTKLTVFFLICFGTVLTEHLMTGSCEKQIFESMWMMECFMMDLLSLISDSKTDLILVLLISNLTQFISSDLILFKVSTERGVH